jgi:hypothetical protein
MNKIHTADSAGQQGDGITDKSLQRIGVRGYTALQKLDLYKFGKFTQNFSVQYDFRSLNRAGEKFRRTSASGSFLFSSIQAMLSRGILLLNNPD